ncbi:MAG TPA: SDR family oxidoreductase [Salinivirga sp.]|uniref:SDR family oxidoreductase n=1 Tax=Salinivirga sp. TaxID=1970192 RepID=UPI002B49E2BE|nr:SDR family oxidoreductase [Salinivirga sp.]HKK59876.1 SDR family oxidoreductase [Salinivirga sp.]
MTQTKQILITGVAGFIGSNLAEALMKKGYRVSGIDNFATGKHKNIQELQNLFPDFKFTEGDIRDRALLDKVVPGNDIIIHQAALGSVPRSIKDPSTSIDVNITGTTNVFYAAYKHNVERVVYAASSSTYGDSEELPKVEHKIGKPLSPYAISKYVNELLAENFHRIYGLNLIGLRYFNVFGRRQDPESTYAAVIPKFVSQLMNHQPPTINGDGEFSRDFTYIKNVIQANELAATTAKPEALNQVYNVACGEQTSLNELFAMIRKELTQFDKSIAEIKPDYGPTRAGDIPHSLASIELARNLLGYAPQYTVSDGLKEAINWYWKNL